MTLGIVCTAVTSLGKPRGVTVDQDPSNRRQRRNEKSVSDLAKDLTDPEQRPLSGPIYHYTSLDAFLSIVERKVLRATSLHYLNDASEGVLGLSLLQDLARREQEHATGPDRQFLEELVWWLDSPPLRDPYAVYVLCFSEKGDDLSQWRGYTPHGRGISLGIDVGVLVRRMQQLGSGWTFQNCRYKKTAQLAWANAILERLRRAVSEAPEARRGREYFMGAISSELQGILQTAALMKNEAFIDEREVRFISPAIRYDDPRVKFRAGKSTIIPYIDFPLVQNPQNPDDRLLSVDVVVGPGPTQRLAHEAVTHVMRHHRLAGAVNFRSSPIPYREL
jgi:hypothetical protein